MRSTLILALVVGLCLWTEVMGGLDLPDSSEDGDLTAEDGIRVERSPVDGFDAEDLTAEEEARKKRSSQEVSAIEELTAMEEHREKRAKKPSCSCRGLFARTCTCCKLIKKVRVCVKITGGRTKARVGVSIAGRRVVMKTVGKKGLIRNVCVKKKKVSFCIYFSVNFKQTRRPKGCVKAAAKVGRKTVARATLGCM